MDRHIVFLLEEASAKELVPGRSGKIAPHLELTNRRSPSFYHFVEGVRRVVEAS